MDFPIPLDHSLAFTCPDFPVAVGRIAFEGVVDYCDRLGLRPGDEVRCRLAAPDHVVLSKRGHGDIILPRRLALFIEVVPVPQAAMTA